MRDRMNKFIALGDTVVFNYRNAGDLSKGQVIGFTAKKVKIQPIGISIVEDPITKFSEQIAVVKRDFQ
jgi:hypothetical protein